MRVDHLEVKNFRCFEHAAFDFAPGFNVLVGSNGSGKSSLLKAIAAAIATPLAGGGGGSKFPHEEDSNARLALITLEGRVRFERSYPVRIDVKGEVVGSARSWWLEKSGPSSQSSLEHTVYTSIADEAARIVQGKEGALPVAAFYSAERNWQLSGVTVDAAVRQQDARVDGYRSWHNASLDMKGLESWIVAKSLERLEQMSEAGGVMLSGGPLDELALVSKAIELAVPGARSLRYDIKFRRVVLDWDGRDAVPFDALSDGQRGLIALTVDIARRMCLLNPQLGNHVLMKTPGIVIIDELDMHLHPAWQRRIVGFLKTTFPLVQFFAATHSPQIIGELEAHEILLMRDGKTVGHPNRALGLDSAQVLEEIMGTSPQNEAVGTQLAEIHRALDDEKIDEAASKIESLQAEVGDIPSVIEVQSELHGLRWLSEDER